VLESLKEAKSYVLQFKGEYRYEPSTGKLVPEKQI